MPKYCVRFYKRESSIVRCDIEVEAGSPEAARQRVEDAMNGEVDLTDEEWESEGADKEEVDGSEFLRLEDEDDPNAVVEIAEDKSEYAHGVVFLEVYGVWHGVVYRDGTEIRRSQTSFDSEALANAWARGVAKSLKEEGL